MPSSASAAKPPADAVRVGPRVYLRHAGLGDVRAYVALRERNRRFLAPWEPRPRTGTPWNDPAALRTQFAEGPTDKIHRLLLMRRADDAMLGMIGLGEIVRGCFQNAYIGYWIGEEFARQGLMREGLSLALDHAFGTLKLHRVEANIQPVNVASLALARALGFRHEGYSPGYLKIAGRWTDHERWALRAEEWKSGRRVRLAAKPPRARAKTVTPRSVRPRGAR